MNQPDEGLARKIVQHLDYSADHLDPVTRERLLDARKAALSRYQEQPEPAWRLAWAGHGGTRQTEHRLPGVRYAIGGAALIVALISIAYWQNNASSPANDFSDVDAALLIDDLPINAYLDKGFDSWLKRSLR